MREIRVNHLVVGAGVVGLSIALELSKISSTFLIERHAKFGMETSSRNSQVIHGGFYYPKESLKTALCIKGRSLLYSFCEKYSIPHLKIGKWIVSTDQTQDHILDDLYQKAKSLDISLNFLSRDYIVSNEPALKFSKVLSSPVTGILDSHAFMECLENLILDKDGQVFYKTEAIKIQKHHSGHGFLVYLKDSPDTVIHADWVINSTGLFSNILSGTLRPNRVKLYFVKGHYVKYHKPIVSRLIYPVPDANVKSLGIHCTLDLSGKLIFGPDVLYIENGNDYSLPTGIQQEELLEKFYKATSRYISGIDKSRLSVDYAGIRPKLSGENDPFQDFIIEKEQEGFINLLGIESPGLTASLAIGEYVKGLIYD